MQKATLPRAGRAGFLLFLRAELPGKFNQLLSCSNVALVQCVLYNIIGFG